MGAEPGPDTWTVAEAKARLSEVIERARAEGPQAITRHGRRTVVVVEAGMWERTKRRGAQGSLAEFLLASPLPESGLEVERLPGGVRDVDL